MMVFEACLKPLLQAKREDQDSVVPVNNKLKVDLTECRGIFLRIRCICTGVEIERGLW